MWQEPKADSPAPPAPPEQPTTDARLPERESMVRLITSHGITTPRILQALLTTPRHAFVPAPHQHEAYDDSALPLAFGQTISQPYIVALMTDALSLTPTSRVLEIGTGSGYQSAVLSHLAAHVYTIELHPELADRARKTLTLLNHTNITCRVGDGHLGWPEEAPFDAILVAAAPPDVPQPLLDQLAPGGRLCIPIGADPNDQHLFRFVKSPDGTVSSERLARVRFVPMTLHIQR